MAISDWPEDERPREKLLRHGAASLSDAELLAIFFRTGVAGRSAVALAKDCLNEFGGLQAMLNASQAEFCAVAGLGPAKYAQLHAVMVLARRSLAETLREAPVFAGATASREFLAAQLGGEQREVFAILYLNTQHRLIQYEPLFFGTIDAAAIYPREILRKALACNASALIVAHNHPSGIAEPSSADRQITERIQQALALVDIRLLDHCVVGRGEVVSFAERGWL